MTPTNSESTSEIPKDSAKTSRGHAHQRVFLKSGTIIQRPPVLFRIPDLQNTSASKAADAQPPGEESSSPTSSHFRVDEAPAQNQIVATLHQTFPSATAEDSSSTWVAPQRDPSPHIAGTRDADTRGTRAGETIAAKTSESTLRIDIPREDSGLRNSEQSREKLQETPASTAGPSPGPIKFAFPPASDRTPGSQHLHSAQSTTPSSEKAPTGETFANRTNSPSSEGLRSTYAIPALDPAPAGRNWIEMLGSRVMIFLVIGAIAAIAYVANQSGNFPSEATIADLQDEAPQDRLSSSSSQAKASEDSLNVGTAQLSPATAPLSRAASPAQGDSSLPTDSPNIAPDTATEIAPSLRSPADGQRITANQPDFDLEALLDETAAESADTMPNTLSDRSNQSVPSTTPDRQSGEISPRLPSPDASSPRVSLNPSTTAAPASAPQAMMGTPSQSASRTSQQPSQLEGNTGDSFPTSRNSVIREGQATTTRPPASSGVTPEEAIRRAADAAISGGFSSRSNPTSPTAGAPSVDPVTGLRMTQHPWPVPDWTRYLPPPPAGLNPPALNPLGVAPGSLRSSDGAPGVTPMNPYQAIPDFQPSAPNIQPSGPSSSQMPLVPGNLINPPAGRQFDGQSSNFSAAGYAAPTLQPPPSSNTLNGAPNPYAMPQIQRPGQNLPGAQGTGQNTGLGYPTMPPITP